MYTKSPVYVKKYPSAELLAPTIILRQHMFLYSENRQPQIRNRAMLPKYYVTDLSRAIGTVVLYICENKGADKLRGNNTSGFATYEGCYLSSFTFFSPCQET